MKGSARTPRGLGREVGARGGAAATAITFDGIAPTLEVVGGAGAVVWRGVPGLERTMFRVGLPMFVQELDTGARRGWGTVAAFDASSGTVALYPTANEGFASASPADFDSWLVSVGEAFAPELKSYRCEGVASGAVLSQRVIHVVPRSRAISSVKLAFDSGWTPDGTNNNAIVLDRPASPGSLVTIPLTPSGLATPIVGFHLYNADITTELVAGDVVTIAITKSGAGAAVPGFVVLI